jgi:hypothetical protein
MKISRDRLEQRLAVIDVGNGGSRREAKKCDEKPVVSISGLRPDIDLFPGLKGGWFGVRDEAQLARLLYLFFKGFAVGSFPVLECRFFLAMAKPCCLDWDFWSSSLCLCSSSEAAR